MAISKVATVTDILMSRIISREYKTVLPPQDTLSRNLEVSRTVVREAISKLETWNILVVRPKTGTTINPPEVWSLVNTELVFSRLKAECREVNEATIDRMVQEIRSALFKAADLSDSILA